MSGIDRTSGHIGMSQATRTASTMQAMGNAAFSMVANVGTAAAGVAGGPLAAAGASAAMSGMRSGVSSLTGSGSGIDGIVAEGQANTNTVKQKAGEQMTQSNIDNMELFMLQQTMNSQSQAFNTLTNMQKAKHDAAMAAIQNTR